MGDVVEADEAHEVADAISESAHGAGGAGGIETFRRRAALALGVIAMLLAIASLGGENATKETVNNNILASDTYGFYQAKYERQTSYRLAANQLAALLASPGDWPAAARTGIEEKIADYRATIDRYESDPVNGDGKKELLAKAKAYEQKREHAQRQDLNFDFARALFQIAIVLGSVSIVATSRALLGLCGVLAVLAALLSLNGFFLLVPLPFE